MKVIKKSINEYEKERVRIEKEIMRICTNPFLVKLHATFQTSDKLFFVLDYVNGGELNNKLIKSGKLKEDLVKFYAGEILLGLKSLHENGFIHRDLNPRNILINSDGHLKIIDFGLSKINDNAKPSETCGTAAYCAPEIIKGKGHDVTMDFWSLGVLVYEMLHGEYPF
mmetsp:Transcript_1284/g.1439  ORF Transcript_1284/g.1439 Transcript_1284/m.1439 type:complete len:168 (+) Transcript_1284:305-808(+)